MDHFLDKLKEKVTEGVSELIEGHEDKDKKEEKKKEEEKHDEQQEAHAVGQDALAQARSQNRFNSFAPQSSGHPKWYVDGASYFYAVSLALEREEYPPIPVCRQFPRTPVLTDTMTRGSRDHLHPRLVADPRALPSAPPGPK